MFMIFIMQVKVSLAQIMNCKYSISINVLIYIDKKPNAMHGLKVLTSTISLYSPENFILCKFNVPYLLFSYSLPSNENETAKSAQVHISI